MAEDIIVADGKDENSAGAHFLPGASAWIPDKDESWVAAQVVSQEGADLVVRISQLNRSKDLFRVKASNCYPKDDDPRGVDDMTRLAYLHEPGVLHNILLRFQINQIYTYTGSILIAINPFALIPKLYDEAMKEQYLGAPLGEQAPHVFAVADSAYRAMMTEKKSQSILISGESGAGKTETTKLVMDYLATACGRSGGAGEIRAIESLVLESNPLLEAFGNAKTERNNNSSRFGKFIKVQFDAEGRVSGAAIKSYLLEKSRVVRVSSGERNYHVFYQLCLGSNHEEVKKYGLSNYQVSDFHYLNQSDCYEIEGEGQSAVQFGHLKRAMSIMGLTQEEQDGIFRIISGILHLGNVNFEIDESDDSVRVAEGGATLHLNIAAELFKCDLEGLSSSLLHSSMRVNRDVLMVPVKDTKAAEARRDSLAKNLYSTLFDWIVAKVNAAIGEDKEAEAFIGVLDIYGFEHFKLNSFEQFCINLANEKLQQHFNFHVLKTEQEEYEREEINWSRIPFSDNQDCLDLIEGNRGILSLLDNACLVESTTADMYTRKLFTDWAKHNRLSRPKVARTEFTLAHYAGEVTYSTDEFIVKNKDAVIPEHFDLLSSSADPTLASMFPHAVLTQSLKNKFFSLGASFKQQLARLMEDIHHTEPHYIRCIKPNLEKKPHLFEKTLVVTQLQSGGVLEAVRMCSAGYPTRKEFPEFLTRFRLLAPTLLDDSLPPEAQCTRLLELMRLDGYQIGKTKLFLRAGQMVELEGRRLERMNAARKILHTVCQSMARRWAALVLQASWRGLGGRRDYRARVEERAATTIQAFFRMLRCRQEFLVQHEASLTLQAFLRAHFDRKRYMEARRVWAAVRIQSAWRGYLRIRPWRKLVALVQGWHARRAYKMLQQKKLEEERRLQEERQLAAQGPVTPAPAEPAKVDVRDSLRYMVVRKLREKSEKAKKEMGDMLKVVQRENESLKASGSLKDKELEKLREELRHARQAAISATTAMETVVGEVKTPPPTPRMDRSASVPSNTLLRYLSVGASPHRPPLIVPATPNHDDREAFERLEVGMQKTTEVAEKLKLEVLTLREAKEAAEAKAAMAVAKLEEEEKRKSSEEGLLEQKEMEDLKKKVLKMEASLARKEHEIYVLAQHLLSGSTRPQLNPKAQQQALLQAIGSEKKLGFSPTGHPIAANILYRALTYWRAFDSKNTDVFGSIIDTFQLAEREGTIDVLAYWLANTTELYFLMHQRDPKSQAMFGREDFRVPVQHLDSEVFRVNLGFSIVRLYSSIRNSVRREILEMLNGTDAALPVKSDSFSKRLLSRAFMSRDPAAASYWAGLTDCLHALLETLQHNHVERAMVRALFWQLVQFINLRIFNSLLNKSRWCPCTLSNGEVLRASLAKFRGFLAQADAWVEEGQEGGSSPPPPLSAALQHLEEAVRLLLHERKQQLSVDSLRQLCPSLSANQLFWLGTSFVDDKLSSPGIPPPVLSELWDSLEPAERARDMLQDDRSVPFALEEVILKMPPFDPEDVEVPPSLLSDEAFLFLMPSTAEALSPLSIQEASHLRNPPPFSPAPPIAASTPPTAYSTPPPAAKFSFFSPSLQRSTAKKASNSVSPMPSLKGREGQVSPHKQAMPAIKSWSKKR